MTTTREALERCAKFADENAQNLEELGLSAARLRSLSFRRAAAAIRALAETVERDGGTVETLKGKGP